MANDRNRSDYQLSGPTSDREKDRPSGEEIRGDIGDEVRGVADEEEDEFEDMEDVEEGEEETDEPL
jgi:hypothetical protein